MAAPSIRSRSCVMPVHPSPGPAIPGPLCPGSEAGCLDRRPFSPARFPVPGAFQAEAPVAGARDASGSHALSQKSRPYPARHIVAGSLIAIRCPARAGVRLGANTLLVAYPRSAAIADGAFCWVLPVARSRGLLTGEPHPFRSAGRPGKARLSQWHDHARRGGLNQANKTGLLTYNLSCGIKALVTELARRAVPEPIGWDDYGLHKRQCRRGGAGNPGGTRPGKCRNRALLRRRRGDGTSLPAVF